MDDLIKKLNVLLNASLKEALGEGFSLDGLRARLNTLGAGSGLDGEVKMLRQRANDAIAYEGELQQHVVQLQAEVIRLDQQADDAVTRGDEVNARYWIEQMTRAQQRLTMAESDLTEHRKVTQELIVQVNTLEAAVADAKRAEEEKKASAPEVPAITLSDVLQGVREKVTQFSESLTAKPDEAPPVSQPGEQPEAEVSLEDDLEQRRQRLSKR